MTRFGKIKRIRQKVKNGDPSIGTWQQIPHPSISEILTDSGYDWVTVDLEHGSTSVQRLPDLFRAIDLGNALPLARIAEPKAKDCKQALDAGAGGIIAPMIETSDQLKNVVDASCWPPSGSRGVGFSRANLYGKYFEKYSKEAQCPLIIAQIESINGYNNLEQILKINGLDAIMIGPYDLSASMGLTAEFKNKKIIEIMNNILKICKSNNIACGLHIVDPDEKILESKINEGYKFLAYSIDSVFLTKNTQNPNF